MLVSGKELGLEILGITDVETVHRNLPVERLIEETVINGEGAVGPRGATICGSHNSTVFSNSPPLSRACNELH